MLFDIFLNILTICGLFCTLLGAFILLKIFQSPKAPSDSSNRINNIKAIWITINHPEIYAHVYKVFRQDEMDTIKEIEK